MKVIGNTRFSMESEGTEKGDVRGQGDYEIAIVDLTMPLNTDVLLAKDDANIVVGLGGITTVNFLSVKAVFDDPTVANATIELLVNDGAGERTITGTMFLLLDTDITSVKLTSNSHDTTGSAARVFINMAGV